jgi:hypothetical protein
VLYSARCFAPTGPFCSRRSRAEWGQSPFDSRQDRIQDDRLTSVDVLIGDAEHPIALPRQKGVPFPIGSPDRRIATMLLSIDLHDQVLLEAREIDHEAFDRDLSSEMIAERHDALPDPVPELHLVPGHPSPQRTWNRGRKIRARAAALRDDAFSDQRG